MRHLGCVSCRTRAIIIIIKLFNVGAASCSSRCRSRVKSRARAKIPATGQTTGEAESPVMGLLSGLIMYTIVLWGGQPVGVVASDGEYALLP